MNNTSPPPSDSPRSSQVWYDDPESLSTIYKWVIDEGLGGTGPYRWDQLDLAGTPDESQEMWDAIKVVREAN